MHMHNRIAYKQVYDPFYHYSRGVLYFEKNTYTFSAYRMPYIELDKKKWKTEQEFNADYQRVIEQKYSI